MSFFTEDCIRFLTLFKLTSELTFVSLSSEVVNYKKTYFFHFKVLINYACYHKKDVHGQVLLNVLIWVKKVRIVLLHEILGEFLDVKIKRYHENKWESY